jgi:hypothetical protein
MHWFTIVLGELLNANIDPFLTHGEPKQVRRVTCFGSKTTRLVVDVEKLPV